MARPDASSRPPTASAERQRADIDAGRTGDKVPFPDPAAAPLGTDDEAAGVRPGSEAHQDPVRPESSRTPPGQKKGKRVGQPFDD